MRYISGGDAREYLLYCNYINNHWGIMEYTNARYVLGVLRISLGWIFLWAFLDKMFGLGFATTADKAWIAGGSPTSGFLSFATKGPFADVFQSMAGSTAVDWLFMLGLLFVGTSLLLGVMTRLASMFGILMLVLFYIAGFLPPENNPFMDDHITHSLVLLLIAMTGAGRWIGLGKWWSQTRLVQRFPLLN